MGDILHEFDHRLSIYKRLPGRVVVQEKKYYSRLEQEGHIGLCIRHRNRDVDFEAIRIGSIEKVADPSLASHHRDDSLVTKKNAMRL